MILNLSLFILGFLSGVVIHNKMKKIEKDINDNIN